MFVARDAIDVNGDGKVDVADALYLPPVTGGHWLTGLSGLVRLKAPPRAVDAYRTYLTDTLEKLQ